MTVPMDKFKAGDIVRYASGVSALLRLTSPHVGGWHGEHVMGGTYFICDHGWGMRPTLASEADLEFCRREREDWFK